MQLGWQRLVPACYSLSPCGRPGISRDEENGKTSLERDKEGRVWARLLARASCTPSPRTGTKPHDGSLSAQMLQHKTSPGGTEQPATIPAAKGFGRAVGLVSSSPNLWPHRMVDVKMLITTSQKKKKKSFLEVKETWGTWPLPNWELYLRDTATFRAAQNIRELVCIPVTHICNTHRDVTGLLVAQ